MLKSSSAQSSSTVRPSSSRLHASKKSNTVGSAASMRTHDGAAVLSSVFTRNQFDGSADVTSPRYGTTSFSLSFNADGKSRKGPSSEPNTLSTDDSSSGMPSGFERKPATPRLVAVWSASIDG